MPSQRAVALKHLRLKGPALLALLFRENLNIRHRTTSATDTINQYGNAKLPIAPASKPSTMDTRLFDVTRS